MIVRCSHCKEMFSSEDFEKHECNLKIKECKTIEVVYFLDGSYKDRKLMTGQGIDGILYTFEVVPRKPIPIMIPIADEKKQPYRADEEGTAPVFPRTLSFF